MAEVYHLRCLHCGEPMKKNPWPYCAPCNLDLCYRAMPLLLGMLLTGKITPQKLVARVAAEGNHGQSRWTKYPHLRYIMD